MTAGADTKDQEAELALRPVLSPVVYVCEEERDSQFCLGHCNCGSELTTPYPV